MAWLLKIYLCFYAVFIIMQPKQLYVSFTYNILSVSIANNRKTFVSSQKTFYDL